MPEMIRVRFLGPDGEVLWPFKDLDAPNTMLLPLLDATMEIRRLGTKMDTFHLDHNEWMEPVPVTTVEVDNETFLEVPDWLPEGTPLSLRVWTAHEVTRTGTEWRCSCGKFGVIYRDTCRSYACTPLTTADRAA